MKILLMGPPASGKGTIGKLLSKYLKVPLISTGQVLREVSKDSPHYEKINSQMEKGELVTQDLVAELLKDKTKDLDGYILDGWGRSEFDFRYFLPKFDKILYFDLPRKISVERISNRRVCEKEGHVYNLIHVPPKQEGICDEDGSKLIQRKDDSEEIVNKRYDSFEKDTLPVIENFKDTHLIAKLDASLPKEEVFENTKKALGV